MSPRTRVLRNGRTRPTRHRAVQPLAVLWLTLVWTVLWRDVSVLVVASGVLVGVLVCVVFPLPPVALFARVRPWPLVVLGAGFAVAVVRASVEVALVVLRRRPLRNAIVRVDLESSSDLVLTGVATMLSLVPGSVVVETRRSTHTLYLHVLDTPDLDRVERFRAEAAAAERRFVAAFVPREEPT